MDFFDYWICCPYSIDLSSALPIRPGKDSKEVYDFVEGLADSSKVLLSCEYGPSTKPEIHPMVTSFCTTF